MWCLWLKYQYLEQHLRQPLKVVQTTFFVSDAIQLHRCDKSEQKIPSKFSVTIVKVNYD